ncbi:P-loop containing nucleoside triphosphate hydrolase protein [Tothia fuscella]|uniref:P-loop containing nucleoside triphosphate hydrolase protein n=1 Tax=Tothia fuscella TaxID=1048955 RepID=A0A9P4TWX2_9PEZI|nr:P-loop containing nucleoside triphosphate hydrolase protein [Tothia fuscella]
MEMHNSSSSKSKDHTAAVYYHQGDAPRVNTDLVIIQSLEKQYPGKEIITVPESSCNLLAFAASGIATAIPDEKNATDSGPLKWDYYFPPASRLEGGSGVIGSNVLFGKYKYIYKDYEYILYIVDGRDGGSSYPLVRNNYIISSTSNSAKALILAAGDYHSTLHGEIWVFDAGWWHKDAALWDSIQRSTWDDVILDEDMKKAIIGDVSRFYDGRDVYKRLKVPWKRGIIYHGPPGNGKTISIKATMHMLYERKDEIPTLYVKTLTNFAGPEYALNQIFEKARTTAPCYLVFEDLDSIVSDSVRSFFLNQVDGLNNNDGILMVGSTNHLDRLDPGISKRPSRFDRKYLFPNPNFKERTLYAEFWRKKLLGSDAAEDFGTEKKVDFPESMCKGIANITDGFSFAYIQEAFVASLLAIAARETEDSEPYVEKKSLVEEKSLWEENQERIIWKLHGFSLDEDDEKKEFEKLELWQEMKKQVKILREEMGGPDDGGD